jgi:hypothetical protein
MDKINYFLYHIPGKKIGVTRDLISLYPELLTNRVTA